MVPETRDEIINNLIETVWNNIQDEEFYIRRDVFKNLKKTIRKSLYQNVVLHRVKGRFERHVVQPLPYPLAVICSTPPSHTQNREQNQLYSNADFDHLAPSNSMEIRSFLEKTTTEQWRSFLSSSADDATKVLVAELILEIIAALSNSVVASMKSGTPKTEEHLMSELEVSLPQTFSEALGIPDEVDNISLKTLTGVIHEEVKNNLISGGKAGVTKHLTPVFILNSMTDQLIHLIQKFSAKIKTLVAPRPWKSITSTSKGTKKSPSSQAIRKINDQLRDIINPLLEDIPNSEELQKEVSWEI
eukprot:XP_011605266.1 PREDICTED: uncharacterized protein LOC105416889 [Takifugu rubripes]